MNNGNQYHRWLMTLPAAGLAVVYVLVFFLPGQRAIEQLSGELMTRRDLVAQAGGIAAAIQVTQHELEKTLAYNADWQVHSPSEKEVAGLFGKICSLAKQAGSQTTRFDPDPAMPMKRVRWIPVAIGCTGSFAQIAEFLCQLESLPQAIWAENAQIESYEGDGGSVTCEIDVMVFADNSDDSNQAGLTE